MTVYYKFNFKIISFRCYNSCNAGSVPPPQVKTVNTSKDKVVLEVSSNTDGRPYSIVGYKRLDLGLPIHGEYWELSGITNSTHELKALVPGATYRITVWGVVGYVNRSSQPAVLTVRTKNSSEFTSTTTTCLSTCDWCSTSHRSISSKRPHYHKNLSTWN